MQKLFSMFPPGLPGLALLLVRASVALALLLTDHGHHNLLPGGIHGAVILISVALAVGYLTPIAAAAALVLHGLLWWFGAGIDSAAAAAVVALDAIALALLGPGAYSIDSYRFGRHRVVLPPE
jgi:hypothetical protein